MLPTALLAEVDLADRDVIWFVDNTVALHSFVKGICTNAALSRVVEVFHILCYRLQCHVWFEYVASGDNWADGISRDGFDSTIPKSCNAAPIVVAISDSWWTRDLA